MAPRQFECDDTILHPLVKESISLFYEAADTEDHEYWASFFADDGSLKKGAAESNGKDAILAARKNSWKSGQTKEHIVFLVCPLKNQSLDVMVRGMSKWHYADGTHYDAKWAAYMGYVKVGEEVKLKDYEIYMPLPPTK